MNEYADVDERRFMAHVDQDDPSGCWLWTSYQTGTNYAGYYHKGKTSFAHRVSYSLFVGPIPPGMFVLHTCDVRMCVNPDHLYLGTHVENARDRSVRGRSCHGEAHLSAKLTEDDVRAIRLAHPEKGCAVLAREYGVVESNIYQIANRLTWKHVE